MNTVSDTWFEASEACQDLPGGRLAAVDTPDVFDTLKDTLLNITLPINGYWVGLHKAGWMWVTGIVHYVLVNYPIT